VAGVGRTLVSIEPVANVIVDPAIFQERSGTVRVTAAGAYTVRCERRCDHRGPPFPASTELFEDHR
jgi:hypothetical protein